MWGRILALLVVLPGAVFAEAPTTSIRPMPRPLSLQTAEVALVQTPQPPAIEAKVPVPKPRPFTLLPPVEPEPDTAQPEATEQLASSVPSTPPKHRPSNLVSKAAAAPSQGAPAAKGSSKKSKKGSVCGDSDIKGEAIAAIPAKYKGCGLAEPVRVSMVSGVALSPAAIISCDTADALKQWIETGMNPAFGNRKVVELKVAASYICRTRNNKKGAKISEHGRGKAIDISGFVMSDGKLWTVAGNYNSTIRKAHKAACGIFGTTLGPGSDGYHEDHLHFDIARYNSGPYCR